MTALHQLDATTIAARVQAGELSATAVLEATLARIAAIDPQLHAFVETWPERAQRDARAIDAARATGCPLGPLAGVPIAVKDNLLVEGQGAAAGSRMLRDFVAPYSATAVQRLVAAGAVLLGRTNMDEFGMGSTTESSVHGLTRNPWANDHVPGGSSGGAAAAVAADLCALALGSDTGGSVRQPAAFCGVSGLRPTYGRNSRCGLIAYASSLDCVGGLARSAQDLALLFDVLAGVDPADPTTLDAPVPDHRLSLTRRADLRGLRFGLPAELNEAGIDADVAQATQAALTTLRDAGAEVRRAALPHARHAVATYYLIATAEAASNLARYDGVRFGHRTDDARDLAALYAKSRGEGFGREVQLRILLGTFGLSRGHHEQFYDQATRVRTLLRQDFAAAFARCDVLVCPTTPTAAYPLGSHRDDPVKAYLGDALTVPSSLAGLPALSLPCGFTTDGRPIGLQLIGPPLREDLLLQVAHVFQQRTDWHARRPLP